MVTKDNEPIYRRANGSFVVRHGAGVYGIAAHDEECLYPHSEVEAYLAEHPEALVPEPVPLPPSKEEIDKREEQSLLAYLSSTDWYVVRFAETGEEVPNAVLVKRQEARDRISELRA